MGDSTSNITQDRTIKALHSAASKIRIWANSHLVPDPEDQHCPIPTVTSNEDWVVEHLQEKLLETASAQNGEDAGLHAGNSGLLPLKQNLPQQTLLDTWTSRLHTIFFLGTHEFSEV